jgi:Sec-independent protein translocase protein TatA
MAFGWGELFMTTGVIFLVVGKKDLPVAARGLGGMVGRVVGTLQRARAQITNMTKDNELSEVANRS